LEPQVAFWRNVYSQWSVSQVALHDDKYLDLVYEVISLPDSSQDGYTESQRDFIREQQLVWKTRLQELERKVAIGEALSPSEKALADRITASVGPNGIFGAAERLRGQRGLRERFKRGLEISKRYDAIFKNIFRQAGLPDDLAYLPHVESSFQAYAHSSAGAVGIWQFTKPAARLYLNNHPALDERLDPVASARGAARYLRDAYGTLGDWPLAVTSYNHGIGGMTRARQYFGTDFMQIVRYYEHPAFGFASRNFYAEFLAAREIANQPSRFFPDELHYEAPLNWDRVVLKQPALTSELAFHYGVDKQQLITMNAAWTETAVFDKMTLPEGTEVWLPTGTLTRLAQLQQTPESILALVYKKTPEQ
jgi:membrane-bound lytic murein transglycosylase D